MAEEIVNTSRPAENDSALYGLMKRLFRNKAAVFGLIIIALMFLCALFAPMLATYDFAKQDLPSMLHAPIEGPYIWYR